MLCKIITNFTAYLLNQCFFRVLDAIAIVVKLLNFSALEEAEQKEKKMKEESERAAARVREIQRATNEYHEERVRGEQELHEIREHFEQQVTIHKHAHA